jgi:hypothetical protein
MACMCGGCAQCLDAQGRSDLDSWVACANCGHEMPEEDARRRWTCTRCGSDALVDPAELDDEGGE